MKKIVLFLSILFLVFSCTSDDKKVHYETLPIQDVVVPNSFTLGQTYTITVRYFRPTTCHAFDDFYYEKALNVRTIAVQSIVFENNNCSDLTDELKETTFDFFVANEGSYVFKFWQGKDAQGEDMFLEFEVPVI
jgi:hypothetical protein